IARIQSLGLDILLNLALPSVEPTIVAAARYGIWEFTSLAAPVHSHPYVGFWEVYNSEPVTKVSLRATTPDGRRRVLGETQIRTQPGSLVLTKNWALESAITLLRYAAARLSRDPLAGLEPLTRFTYGAEQAVIPPATTQILRLAARASRTVVATKLDSYVRRI